MVMTDLNHNLVNHLNTFNYIDKDRYLSYIDKTSHLSKIKKSKHLKYGTGFRSIFNKTPDNCEDK